MNESYVYYTGTLAAPHGNTVKKWQRQRFVAKTKYPTQANHEEKVVWLTLVWTLNGMMQALAEARVPWEMVQTYQEPVRATWGQIRASVTTLSSYGLIFLFLSLVLFCFVFLVFRFVVAVLRDREWKWRWVGWEAGRTGKEKEYDQNVWKNR